MSKNIQELVYDYVAETLNKNTQGLYFQSGYHIAIYNGIPTIIDDDGNNFDIKKMEVIPLSENSSTETAYANAVDRAQFASQYKFSFRIEGTTLDKVRTALKEYRTYMLENAQTTLDGYTVSFKTTQGNKEPDVIVEDGSFYGQYSFTVYYEAIKNGYISNETGWEIAFFGDTYSTLYLAQDIASTTYNTQVSNKEEKITHYNTSSDFLDTMLIYYDGSAISKELYKMCMNKGDMGKLFKIRETFDGIESEYKVIVMSASRTKIKNGVILMEVKFVEV